MMKITKRRKIILSSVLVAMVAITAGFEISSSQVMEPISQTGDIKEMDDVLLVSQKNITGRTRFATFGKDGKKIEYGKNFLTKNFVKSNIGLRGYINLTKKNMFDTYDLTVGDKIYFISQKIENEKNSLVVNIQDKKSNSTTDKEINIKDEDLNSRLNGFNLTGFVEKDGKFYTLVTSSEEIIYVLSLDMDKCSYKIVDSSEDIQGFSPSLFVQSWNENDKYIYLLMKNVNVQDENVASNYILRYDFKTEKFLKPLPLEEIEVRNGFEDIENLFLHENTADKFIVYTVNAKDKHLYKLTYNLENMKFEKKEKLNLIFNSIVTDYRLFDNRFVGGNSDDSRVVLLNGKIYYISLVKTNILRNDNSMANSEVNIDGMNISTLKIFDIEKNKVVYEADFDSLEIETPIFVRK